MRRSETAQVIYGQSLSWGEVFPQFIGNREHSIAARFILPKYPFKLFSSSEPYSRLPQVLCLVFKQPTQIAKHEMASLITYKGVSSDVVAREFAAFLSVFTRRRIFASGMTREDGLPIEAVADIYPKTPPMERQHLREIDPATIYRLLANLQKMERKLAESYVLATRMYHTAVEMMYSEPEFSYLFLVTCIETISSVLYQNERPNDFGSGHTELDQFLDSNYPAWRQLCDISTTEKRQRIVEMLLSQSYFVQRKFRHFLTEYVTNAFWDDLVDDAKPKSIYSAIVPGTGAAGKEEYHESETTLQEWEKIKRSDFRKAIDRIYKARSELVHAGKRLPSSIVVGHFPRMPMEAVEELMALASAAGRAGPNSSSQLSLPPLLTFERLVSYCLVEFLNRQDSNTTLTDKTGS